MTTLPKPLRPTPFMWFEEVPNPRRTTRMIVVWNKRKGYDIGRIHWHRPWRQYVFEPALGTLFNIGCLNSIADRLAYLNTMHHRPNRKEEPCPSPSSPRR